jgi:hypothetical protein
LASSAAFHRPRDANALARQTLLFAGSVMSASGPMGAL